MNTVGGNVCFGFFNIKMACASQEITSTTEKCNLLQVETVVQSWMTDYYFATLCRLFRERSAVQFRKALKIYEDLVDEIDSCSLSSEHPSQRTICCFLARVMDGQNLDVRYDHAAHITPLMSALPIWKSLKDVSDSALYTKIQTLLIVQGVGVCVKKGKYQKAKDTLLWLEKETEIPEKLKGKLATVVSKKEAYDPVLMNFTFDQLLESIDTFLDTYNQQCSSVFLLEAASKVVQARERSENASERGGSERTPSIPESNKSEGETQEDPTVPNVRAKRKLLSTQTYEPWKPETAQKRQTKCKRTSIYKVSRRTSIPLELQGNVSVSGQQRRRWTLEEDGELRKGVRKYGVGKWSKIVNNFQFDNRTSVNLKDRWRVLRNLGQDY